MRCKYCGYICEEKFNKCTRCGMEQRTIIEKNKKMIIIVSIILFCTLIFAITLEIKKRENERTKQILESMENIERNCREAEESIRHIQNIQREINEKLIDTSNYYSD